MAIGKLAILIGAGLFGSALSKEGGLSDVTGLFSGALKIVTKHLQQDKSSPKSSGKSHSDSLLTQVNSLRQELQVLASSRSVTVVTTNGSGSGTYGTTFVVVFAVGAVGYGYIWWKGWKLSDLMFVTRRSFKDSVNIVADKLDVVSSSVNLVERDLTSKIHNVDSSVNECLEIASGTKEEVLKLHGDLSQFHGNVEYIQGVVSSLETKLVRIEQSQSDTTQGVIDLCKFAQGLELLGNTEQKQMLPSSSKLALEPPQAIAITRTGSLPPLAPSSPLLTPIAAPSSPSAAETPQVLRPPTTVLRPPTTLSAAAFQDLKGKTRAIRTSTAGPSTARVTVSEIPFGEPSVRETQRAPRIAALESPKGTSSVQEPTSNSSNPGWFRLPSILTRSRSTAS